MLSFKTFLIEAVENTPEPLQVKHITHVEDHPLQNGSKGFEHAHGTLMAAHKHIKSGKTSSKLTVKYDGSPAVIYGHHPETGKFFVASKSAFNKNPKINYSESDIEKNHGHAPGLVSKLKHALKHLPKIAPKHGIYQGDFMHDEGEKKHEGDKVSFHPNPSGLTYTATGEHAKKAKRAKIGFVTHMKYEGSNLTNLSAHSDVDYHNFSEHPDVHHIDPRYNTSKAHYDSYAQKQFLHHAETAQAIHKKYGKEMYPATERHQGAGGHLETYINHTVRTSQRPTAKGFKDFLKGKYETAQTKYKTSAKKEQLKQELDNHIQHITKNDAHYNNLFNMHHHLQQAKNVLITALNHHQEFEHSHHGEKANPEGYVIHHQGSPSKLVQRDEFSRRNLLGRNR